MNKKLSDRTRQIIETNQYMTIGSASADGTAWASAVAYAFDDAYTFYFISLPDSQHAKNFTENPHVTCAIFDSHQMFGEGSGLQIEGVIKKVAPTHLPKVISLYLARNWPYMNEKLKTYMEGFKKIVQNHTYTAYEFIPSKFWMNDPDADVDVRVEVSP